MLLASTVPGRTETTGVLIVRKLIATVFNYSLDGLLADEGTEFWKFCFDLPENRELDDPAPSPGAATSIRYCWLSSSRLSRG